MTTTTTTTTNHAAAATTSGAAIQRYKIGYHSDEWGVRSSTPSGIPDASGSWVRYEDHVTALKAAQPVVTPQPGAAYAAGPEPQASHLKSCPCGATPDALHISGEVKAKWADVSGSCCGEWSIEYRNNYAELSSPEAMELATTAWNEAPRAAHGQAPAQAAPAAMAGPVAVLRFERSTPGRQNEMPRVVSCNWMPDGEYEVYLAAAPTTQPALQQEPALYDPKALLEVFQRAQAGSSGTAGTLRGITAVIAAWESREPHTLIAAPQPSPAVQGDALDAARWRALLACGRIRIIGTAGVTGTGAHDPKALDPNKQPYGNYVHFGAEFWSTFPDQDYYNTKENPAYARATLTEFADAARAAQEGKSHE